MDNFTLTEQQQQKLRDLRAMVSGKREAVRRQNYMRPQGKNYQRLIQRDQQRAQLRLEGVVYGLMARYADEKDIPLDELQNKIAEDPMLIESFYQEATELIPKHYLPLDMANIQYFAYYPYRNNGKPYSKAS